MATGKFSTIKVLILKISSSNLEPKSDKKMTAVEEIDAKMTEINASL